MVASLARGAVAVAGRCVAGAWQIAGMHCIGFSSQFTCFDQLFETEDKS